MTQIDSSQFLAFFSSSPKLQGPNDNLGFAKFMSITELSAALPKSSDHRITKASATQGRSASTSSSQRQSLAVGRQDDASLSPSKLAVDVRSPTQHSEVSAATKDAKAEESTDKHFIEQGEIVSPGFAVDPLVDAQNAVVAMALEPVKNRIDALMEESINAETEEHNDLIFALQSVLAESDSVLDDQLLRTPLGSQSASVMGIRAQSILGVNLQDPDQETEFEIMDELDMELDSFLSAKDETAELPIKVKTRNTAEPLAFSVSSESRVQPMSLTTSGQSSEPRMSLTPQINVQSLQPRAVMTAEQLADRMQQRVMLMVGQKLQQAFIRLDPPELGKLEIQIQKQDERVQLVVVAQTPQARELIEQNLPRLKELLAQQGMDLTDFDARDSEQQQHDSTNAELQLGDENEVVDEIIQISTALVDQYV